MVNNNFKHIFRWYISISAWLMFCTYVHRSRTVSTWYVLRTSKKQCRQFNKLFRLHRVSNRGSTAQLNGALVPAATTARQDLKGLMAGLFKKYSLVFCKYGASTNAPPGVQHQIDVTDVTDVGDIFRK